MNNLRTSPKVPAKTFPLFFHGAFAPSFIWRRRPCYGGYIGAVSSQSPGGMFNACLDTPIHRVTVT